MGGGRLGRLASLAFYLISIRTNDAAVYGASQGARGWEPPFLRVRETGIPKAGDRGGESVRLRDNTENPYHPNNTLPTPTRTECSLQA